MCVLLLSLSPSLFTLLAMFIEDDGKSYRSEEKFDNVALYRGSDPEWGWIIIVNFFFIIFIGQACLCAVDSQFQC